MNIRWFVARVRFDCLELSNPRSSCHVTFEESLGLPSSLDWSSERARSYLKPALESIKPAKILDHIKVLASNEFEGRGPGHRARKRPLPI